MWTFALVIHANNLALCNLALPINNKNFQHFIFSPPSLHFEQEQQLISNMYFHWPLFSPFDEANSKSVGGTS